MVVLHDQDGFASVRSIDDRGRRGRLARLFERARQQDLEGGANPRFAVNRQAAARLGDDSVAGR
jgi:hypothetical protein